MKYSKQTYLDEFLSLRCAGDVLNIVSPIQSVKKEISESMSVIKILRGISLSNPMNYTLYDFCAGNALTSLTAIHLLPFKEAIAIDKRKRKREFERAKRFKYLFEDIDNLNPDDISPESTIISVHACKQLAEKTIDIYNKSKAKHLILMPCCIGKIKISVPHLFRELIGKYLIWCWQLASLCKGQVSIKVDKKCLSPANALIVGKK